MIVYLSGCITPTILANPRADLGLMLQPGLGGGASEVAKALSFWSWAADNACFAAGDRFDAGDWLEWLASMRRWRATCLFATAPDVVGAAGLTLARSAPYLQTIRQLGYSPAFVSQNDADETPIPWDDFDWLFVGGDDDARYDGMIWKLSERSWELCAAARRRGKRVHLGRCNSMSRLRACRVSLVDSADGTYVKFGPDQNLPKVYDWLDRVNAQSVLVAA